MQLFNNFFKNKKVLVTGHTGFKGSWLSIWLNELGADVTGYALDPKTGQDNFVVSNLSEKINDVRGDIRDFDKIMKVINNYQPEVIFHLAAQPLVRESYRSPRYTYETNVMGTVNIFEGVKQSNSVKILVNVTSDKCYKNKEWIWSYRENEELGGYDPYSSSKACSELVTAAYQQSFFNPNNFSEHQVAVASVRAGNVIGGGDWSEDRLIPDCIRALKNNQVIKVRNPDSTRPWQHVLEPLFGYLKLAWKLRIEPKKYIGAWNFGPTNHEKITVGQIVDLLIDNWGNGSWESFSKKTDKHEANLLSLDVTKAIKYLDWKPIFSIRESIQATIEWYKKYPTLSSYQICLEQIKKYIKSV